MLYCHETATETDIFLLNMCFYQFRFTGEYNRSYIKLVYIYKLV